MNRQTIWLNVEQGLKALSMTLSELSASVKMQDIFAADLSKLKFSFNIKVSPCSNCMCKIILPDPRSLDLGNIKTYVEHLQRAFMTH